MTWPVTPNPGIHNEPTGRTQVPGPLLTPQQVAAWAVELPLAMTKYVLTALFNALKAEIPPQLLGPLENADTALNDVASSLQSAFEAIPGVNLAAGPLNSALTIGGVQLGTLLAHLSSTGQYDASQLYGALNEAVTVAGTGIGTLLENINGSGEFLGSAITGSVAGSLVSGALTGATIAGSAITGTIAASLISGALTGATIAGADVTGALNAALTVEGMTLSTVESSVSAWTAFLAQVGASSTAQFGSALAGLMPAMIDNFDGTVTYIGGQATDNGDGTITFANQVGSQAINSLIDAGDGTVMSVGEAFANAVAGPASILQSGVQGLLTGIQNSFMPSAPVANATAVQANEAMASISAANQAAQERLATIGNGAEMVVDVNFADYSDGAPSGWTVFGSTTLFGVYATAPGYLQLEPSGSSATALYTAAAFLTDYQSLTVLPGGWLVGSALVLRSNAAATQSVYAQLTDFPSLTWTLYGGSPATALCTFTDIVNPNGQSSPLPRTLLAGDPASGNPRHFQLLTNGIPLQISKVFTGSVIGGTVYSDDSAVTAYGAAYRTPGILAVGSGDFLSIGTFNFRDTAQSSPSVLVTTQESTTSTTYTDLPTISDEVVVNIGSTGIVEVVLGANISNDTATGDSFMSFTMSGANTVAASDANAIMYQAWAAGAQGIIGRVVPLTGLNPGLTTFKAKYRSSGSTASFANRSLAAICF